MPTTLTLKNIPDAIYDRLKAAAQTNRRSMNSEVIVCLESVLLPIKVTPSERLARVQELRAALPQVKFKTRDIDRLKHQGRP
jgi:plasmid stability protein